MTVPVQFLFDFGSPNAYLCHRVIPAIEAALAADRPFVIDAVVDPAVPTLPPELSDEQRKTLDKALKQGDPDEAAVREQLGLQRVGNAP